MANKRSDKRVSKKDKIKGLILILVGILGIIIYIGVQFRDLDLGGGLFIILLSFFFILEGVRVRKGKKSFLFTPSFSSSSGI